MTPRLPFSFSRSFLSMYLRREGGRRRQGGNPRDWRGGEMAGGRDARNDGRGRQMESGDRVGRRTA